MNLIFISMALEIMEFQ